MDFTTDINEGGDRMKYGIYAQYHAAEHRPNVLLLGNGILLSCSPQGGKSWAQSISGLRDSNCSNRLLKNY